MPGIEQPKPTVPNCEVNEPAERPRTCYECVYAGRSPGRWLRELSPAPLMTLGVGWPSLLTCVNCVEAPGELREVAPGSICANFRPRRVRPVWTVPPEPDSDELRYIALTRGRFAIVDTADYKWLNRHKWYATKGARTFYASRHHKGKPVYMHRVIMEPPAGMVVDHIDGNGLNNRRGNLRICTVAQNVRNNRGRRRKGRFKGVYYRPKTGKWVAQICCDGKQYCLGTFADEVEAAKAYDRKALELFGEFARLNFPAEIQ